MTFFKNLYYYWKYWNLKYDYDKLLVKYNEIKDALDKDLWGDLDNESVCSDS